MSLPIQLRENNPTGSITYSKGKKVSTVAELFIALGDQNGCRIHLDCGHFCTIGHNLANTLIINSLGGGRIETWCHNCYL